MRGRSQSEVKKVAVVCTLSFRAGMHLDEHASRYLYCVCRTARACQGCLCLRACKCVHWVLSARIFCTMCSRCRIDSATGACSHVRM